MHKHTHMHAYAHATVLAPIHPAASRLPDGAIPPRQLLEEISTGSVGLPNPNPNPSPNPNPGSTAGGNQGNQPSITKQPVGLSGFSGIPSSTIAGMDSR